MFMYVCIYIYIIYCLSFGRSGAEPKYVLFFSFFLCVYIYISNKYTYILLYFCIFLIFVYIYIYVLFFYFFLFNIFFILIQRCLYILMRDAV